MAQRKSGGLLRRLPISPVFYSTAQADADRSEGAMKGPVFDVALVDAHVHRAEEHIGAIAEADFGVGIAERESSKDSDIRYDDGTRVIVNSRRMVIDRGDTWSRRTGGGAMIQPSGGPMRSLCFLAPEQKRSVDAPIDSESAILVANHCNIAIPRNRRTQAAKASAAVGRGHIVGVDLSEDVEIARVSRIAKFVDG